MSDSTSLYLRAIIGWFMKINLTSVSKVELHVDGFDLKNPSSLTKKSAMDTISTVVEEDLEKRYQPSLRSKKKSGLRHDQLRYLCSARGVAR